jgi:hypothetical protein
MDRPVAMVMIIPTVNIHSRDMRLMKITPADPRGGVAAVRVVVVWLSFVEQRLMCSSLSGGGRIRLDATERIELYWGFLYARCVLSRLSVVPCLVMF